MLTRRADKAVEWVPGAGRGGRHVAETGLVTAEGSGLGGVGEATLDARANAPAPLFVVHVPPQVFVPDDD